MRIVAGIARGLRIAGPGDDTDARPTLDKVREALFNIIEVRGASFLDLFSGSGAVACEAISRGADRVVLVDNQKNAVKLIKDNLAKVVRMVEVSQQAEPPSAELLVVDAWKFIKGKGGENFGFIFCDPPYAEKKSPELVVEIMESHLLGEGGLLVFETSTRRVDDMPQPDRIRKYGDSSLLFYRKKGKGSLEKEGG